MKNKKKPLICKKNIPVRLSPADYHFKSEGALSTYKVIDTVGQKLILRKSNLDLETQTNVKNNN